MRRSRVQFFRTVGGASRLAAAAAMRSCVDCSTTAATRSGFARQTGATHGSSSSELALMPVANAIKLKAGTASRLCAGLIEAAA